MRNVLVDTSAIYALVDSNDPNHSAAAAFVRREGVHLTLVLSDYVFSETMTLVKARQGADAAVQVGRRLRTSRMYRLVYLTAEDEQSTWNLFCKYIDKGWSYVDCSCLALMRSLGINEAFAFDRHFNQMGILCLPLPK